MEHSVSTESELLRPTYTSLGLLYLPEVAEQPSMGGWSKSTRVTHYVRQNILYRLHAALCGKRVPPLSRNILPNSTCLTELCPLLFNTFPACLADMTSRARPPLATGIGIIDFQPRAL